MEGRVLLHCKFTPFIGKTTIVMMMMIITTITVIGMFIAHRQKASWLKKQKARMQARGEESEIPCLFWICDNYDDDDFHYVQGAGGTRA